VRESPVASERNHDSPPVSPFPDTTLSHYHRLSCQEINSSNRLAVTQHISLPSDYIILHYRLVSQGKTHSWSVSRRHGYFMDTSFILLSSTDLKVSR
jgi:hypothetical protein